MPISVSVVITTKNRPTFASQAIASVVHQTESVAEIVVVDDGSDLPTQSHIKEQISEKCTFIRNENSCGVSAARNMGTKAATGDWVLFLDDDDWLSKDYIKELKKFLNTNDHSVDFCWPSRTLVHESTGAKVDKDISKLALTKKHPNSHVLESLMETGCSGSAFKRTTLIAVGGFDESLTMSEDRDLSFRLIAAGHFGRPVSSARIFIRVHNSDRLSTTSKDNSQAESDIRVILKNIELLRAYPVLADKYVGRVARRLWERGLKKEAIRTINLLCSIQPLSFRARKRQIIWTIRLKIYRN